MNNLIDNSVILMDAVSKGGIGVTMLIMFGCALAFTLAATIGVWFIEKKEGNDEEL